MANIDSLNFEVILNDEKFNKKIEKDLENAKRLNTSLTQILNLKSKINTVSNGSYINEQKMAQAAAKTAEAKAKQALAEQKVRTEAEKTALAEQKVRAAIEGSVKSMGGGGSSLQRAWLRFSATIWSIVGAIRLFTQTVGKAIKNISDFQQANANLATIMQVSRREIETLTNDALMLGRTTEWTASQVTELQTALAKLGYNIPQIQNMQASVLQFATAVSANLPDAANMAGAALRMFGMHSTETQKALEILTASTNKTALDFEKLKTALPYVGAIAHSIGMDIAETSSLLGVLANSGLAASRTGTSLRQILLELSKQNGKLQTAMGGNIRTFDDFVNGLQRLRDRGLEAGEATKLVSTRASSALLILANGVDDIRRLNKEVRDTDGLLKDIQAERLDTLHGSTLLLKSAWEGLIQTFRDSAGPMKDIVDWLTKIIRSTSLAASRVNRITQGTKRYMGSDELTKTYTEMFDRLIENGYSDSEARRLVREQMVNRLNKANKAHEKDTQNMEDKWWYKTLDNSIPIARWITSRATRNSRQRGEAIDAIETSMESVMDYIENHAKESAEIAANDYLEEWKLIFDTKGAAAAREAMGKVTGYDSIKGRVEEYIAAGGESGASERGKGSQTAAEKARKDAISDLKAEISLLEKARSAYEKLEPYIGEDAASAWVFEKMGYDVSNLDAEFEQIIADLRKLGDEGIETADAAAARLGLDEASKIVKAAKDAEKAQKALEKYEKTLRKWMGEDFNLGGTGFEYDIRKVFSDYNTGISEVEEKYIEAVKEAEEAHKGDAEAIAEEISKLNELRDSEMAYVRAQSQEKLNKLAESYLKDQYLLRGVSLDHLGDMSIAQLRNLRNELNEISKDAATMGYEFTGLEQMLASWGLDVQNLTEEDLAALRDRLPEATIESIRFMKAIKDTGLSIDTLQEKIQSAIDKGLKNLDEQEKKSIARLAKYAARQVLDLADAFEELGEATGNVGLQTTAESMKAIGDMASNVAQGFTQGGFFGAAVALMTTSAKNIIQDMANDAKEAAEATERMKESIRLYNKELEKAAVASQSTIFGGNNLGKLREYIKILKNSRGLIDKYMGVGNAETSAILKAAGFVDSDGNLIFERIRAGLESGEISGDFAKELESALDSYKNALEEIDSITESLFGDISSELADKLVDSWWDAGRAALDYADILEDVAKSYAKMVVNDLLLGEVFNEERQNALREAFKSGDASRAMAIVAEAMRAAEDMLPAVEQALQVFEPYRTMGGGESNSVGSGIKSISEETANLLASYINAIRADVSYMRTMQEKGWGDVALLGASMPTLNDYLNQVAANTYDTAQNTQHILSELQSVIGAPGTSGSVVRVEAYR